MQEIKRLLDRLDEIESLSTELQKLKAEIAIVKSTTPVPVLVSEKQISAELNICTKTLRKYRYQNILPYLRVGKRIVYDRNEMIQRLRDASKTDSSIRVGSKLSRNKMFKGKNP